MTYLFVLIALAVMNSVLATQADYGRMLASNGAVAAVMFAIEKEWGFHFEASKSVTYDQVQLTRPDRLEELLADLRQRTGLPIRHVKVGKVDLVRDSAELTLFYEDRDGRRQERPSQWSNKA